MTRLEEILEALEASSEGLCDSCIRKVIGISRHQQVQQICSRAAESGRITRLRGPCPACKKTVLVNRYWTVPTERPREPLEVPTGDKRLPESCSWFDSKRTLLVRALNHIDESGKGEPFAKRVSRLRNDKKVPGNIACPMHTFTSFRALVCFEQYPLSEGEWKIVHLVWLELERWLQRKLT